MYTTVATLDSSSSEKTEDVIRHDIESFKKSSPNLIVEKSKNIKINKNDKSAQVYYFLRDSNGNYEAVAYIAELDNVVMVIITSRTEKEFRENLIAFKELVSSYWWITEKVEIK